MLSLRFCTARAAALTAAIALGPLAGCATLNPANDVDAGTASSWTAASASPRVLTASSRRRAPRTTPTPAPTGATVDAARVRPVVSADEPVLLGEAAPAAMSSASIAFSLRDTGADWLGTPYRFGGESRRGIDCSAFTRQMFRESFGIELPRNTALQVQEGFQVDKSELIPGDLVFFRRGGTRHVGVYLGDGEFMHASSSRGVTVSRLDENYYTAHYWTARRILASPSGSFADGVRRHPLTRAERQALRDAQTEQANTDGESEDTDFESGSFEWDGFERDANAETAPEPAPSSERRTTASARPTGTGARAGW